ncbi:MAG: hypothetical protein WCG47_25805 [Dermatophilaceae bacterium]
MPADRAQAVRALADPAGVLVHRRGGFERIEWILADWFSAQAKLVDIEARMVAVLHELGLEYTGSVCLPIGRAKQPCP